MELQRRTALKGGAAAVAGALTGGPFAGLLAPAGAAAPQAPHRRLRAIPDLRDGQVRLHLPEGFQYRSFHDTEFPVVLDDGTNLPGRHDGMGAFPGPDGNILLVRNHEVTNSATATAFGPGTPYDARAGAGTTTIEVTKYGEVVDAYTSLNGTMFNCSGGRMPWGSWITCEETINGPDVGSGLPGAAEHPARAEARLRLRGAGGRPEQPAADHPGRPLPARGRVVRPGRRDPVPHRGQLRVRLGLLPLHPQEQPHGDRVPRQRGPAPDARDHRPAERPSRGAAAAPRDVRRPVGRHRRSPTRTCAPGTHQRPGPGEGRRPGTGPGRGAVLAAGGSGLRHQRRLLHLHPGRRRGRAGPGRRRTTTTTTPAASARATARSGPTTAVPRPCRSSTRRRSTTRRRTSPSTSPTTSPPAPTARSSSARTARSTTTSAGCPAAVSCGTSRSIGWSARSPTRPDSFRRDSATSSPARPSPPTATPCSSTSRPAAA